MALPLQPNLRPGPAWFRRLVVLLCLLAAVLALGYLQSGHRQTARLLHSESGPQNFVQATLKRIHSAEERIWVMLYVLRREHSGTGPVTQLVEALAKAQQRGVDVRVVLDQSKRWQSDEIEGKNTDAAAWLGDLGIPVLIDELTQRTHAKALLIDDDWVIIGSHNWTMSALAYNVELSVMLHDAELAELVAKEFQQIPNFSSAD